MHKLKQKILILFILSVVTLILSYLLTGSGTLYIIAILTSLAHFALSISTFIYSIIAIKKKIYPYGIIFLILSAIFILLWILGFVYGFILGLSQAI